MQKCIICGKSFEPYDKQTKCCSEECSGFNSRVRYFMRSHKIAEFSEAKNKYFAKLNDIVQDKKLKSEESIKKKGFIEGLKNRKCLDCNNVVGVVKFDVVRCQDCRIKYNKIRNFMRRNKIKQYNIGKEKYEEYLKEKSNKFCVDCGRSLIDQKKHLNRCDSCYDKVAKRLSEKYNKKINRKDSCIICGNKIKKSTTGTSSKFCEDCSKKRKEKYNKIRKETKHKKEKYIKEKDLNKYIKELLKKA